MQLESEVIAALIALAGTVVVGVGGTLLGSWLNRKQAAETAREVMALERARYAHDRLWDARREIYSDLVGKLRVLVKAAEEVSEGFHSGELDPGFYFQSEGYDQDNRASVAAYKALAQVYDDGRLMISDAVAGRFNLFLQAIAEADDEDPPTRARAALEAARSAHADLLAMALNEIAPARDASDRSGQQDQGGRPCPTSVLSRRPSASGCGLSLRSRRSQPG